jgi:amphi-Trp domain-containing protein
MGEKNDLPYAQGKMLTYDAAVMLEAIAADLRQRTLAAAGENGPMRIELPAEAKLEIAFKQKVRPDKSKQKLSIEISWKESAPREQSATPLQESAPRQGVA